MIAFIYVFGFVLSFISFYLTNKEDEETENEKEVFDLFPDVNNNVLIVFYAFFWFISLPLFQIRLVIRRIRK